MTTQSTKQPPTMTPARVIAGTAGYLQALSESIGDKTIGLQQLQLLFALYVHGEVNQIDLPKFTGVERSSNSRNIALLGDGLWRARDARGKQHEGGLGLVESYEEPMNRRFKMVRLTPKGKRILEGAAEQVVPFLSPR